MQQVDALWQPNKQQLQFRQLLEAMSRPGKICLLESNNKERHPALPLLSSLVDGQVTIADPNNSLSENELRMLQAIKTEVPQADFILADGKTALTEDPKLGNLCNPEQSATILIAIDGVGEGDHKLTLTGPGIKNSQQLFLSGLDKNWLQRREGWNASFPMGVDILLVDQKCFVALPRTTKLEEV